MPSQNSLSEHCESDELQKFSRLFSSPIVNSVCISSKIKPKLTLRYTNCRKKLAIRFSTRVEHIRCSASPALCIQLQFGPTIADRHTNCASPIGKLAGSTEKTEKAVKKDLKLHPRHPMHTTAATPEPIAPELQNICSCE